MSIDTTLPVPALEHRLDAKDTLFRFHSLCGTESAPVFPVNIEGIVEVNIQPFRPQQTRDVFMPDSDIPQKNGFDLCYSGSIRILTGCAGAFLNALYNRDWNESGPAALPLQYGKKITGVLEAVMRTENHNQHVMGQVFPDLVFDSFGVRFIPGNSLVEIPFVSDRMPFWLSKGKELVVDCFEGDGITTGFSLSAVPVDLLGNGEAEVYGWPHEKLAAIALTQPENCGKRFLTEGISLNGQLLQFSTPPPESICIHAVYAREIVS